MKIRVETLNEKLEEEYESLIHRLPFATIHYSIAYRNFLRAIMSETFDLYFMAYLENRLVGLLPAFVKYGPFGPVVNSLPFYGSHGAVLCDPVACDLVVPTLLDTIDQFNVQIGSSASTLIQNPLQPNENFFSRYRFDYIDFRVGQMTSLPEAKDGSEAESKLMSIFHSKTRNMIRKGLKSGFFVSHDNRKKTFESLHRIHEENLKALGGLPKKIEVFNAISSNFVYDSDYRVYYALNEKGDIISALLIFYFKNMVEYFTPATVEKYRTEQPLSLLIFTAMKDAVIERGSKLWNWGGTWLSQKGVYFFKSRWGALDYPYRYYVKEYKKSVELGNKDKKSLLDYYEYFFTVPFSQVNK